MRNQTIDVALGLSLSGTASPISERCIGNPYPMPTPKLPAINLIKKRRILFNTGLLQSAPGRMPPHAIIL